jgi:hypothetical protein
VTVESYGAMEQFIESPPSSETSELFCRSGRLLMLWSTTCNLQGRSPMQRSTQTTPSRNLTLGGKEQKERKPQKTRSPRDPEGRPGKTDQRGNQRRRFCHDVRGPSKQEEKADRGRKPPSRRIIRPEAVGGWTSLGGSLFSDWTEPFTGEPIPRLSTTSLGGGLFSEWAPPFTGEPVPRSSSTSLGGSLFSDRTCPITGEPIPRSSSRSRQRRSREGGQGYRRKDYYYYYLLQLEWW